MSKIYNAINREGYTVVPLNLHFNGRGMIKVDLGMAKGKKQFDKRQTDKERDWKRSQRRLLSDKNT